MNAIVRTRPGLFDLVGEVDSIFEQLMRPVANADTAASLTPAVDIRETEAGYEVVTDLPGVSRDNLEITIEENILTIKAHRDAATSSEEDPQARIVRSERRRGDYVRTLQLAEDVLQDSVSASLTDGVLRLNLPKAVKAEPRKIDVTVV